jgi:DNA-binding NtrC family response regulator
MNTDAACEVQVPRTVLVVDDERDLADQIVRQLAFRGYQARAAYNAAEAEQEMQRQDYRVVITDIRMPGVQGDELIRDIKKRDGTIQVIAMSGHVRMSRLIHCLRIGATDCFAKPLDLKELTGAVEQAFTRLQRWVSIMKGFHGCSTLPTCGEGERAS